MAWLNPFSPPYDMSTSFRTLPCNLYMGIRIAMLKMNKWNGLLKNVITWWEGIPDQTCLTGSAQSWSLPIQQAPAQPHSPCHLIQTVEQPSPLPSAHSCVFSPFSNAQIEEPTVLLYLKLQNKCLNSSQKYMNEETEKDVYRLPCFLGRSTVNLCKTSLVLPCKVPNRAPLPSITMKPNLLSSDSSAVSAWGEKNWMRHCEKVL